MTLLTHTDILLLLAVLVAGPGEASLKQVLSVGDAINHSILTYQDIEFGIGRLSEKSLVIVSGNNIRASESAIESFNGAKKGSWLDTLQKLKEIYGSVDKLKNEKKRPCFFSKESYDIALSEYKREMHELTVQSLQERHGVNRVEAEKMIESALKWHQQLWSNE